MREYFNITWKNGKNMLDWDRTRIHPRTYEHVEQCMYETLGIYTNKSDRKEMMERHDGGSVTGYSKSDAGKLSNTIFHPKQSPAAFIGSSNFTPNMATYLGGLVTVPRDEGSEPEAQAFHVNPPVPLDGLPVELRGLAASATPLHLGSTDQGSVRRLIKWTTRDELSLLLSSPG